MKSPSLPNKPSLSNSFPSAHVTTPKTNRRLRMVCRLALAALGLAASVQSAYAVSATGGTVTTYTSGGITYKVHTFTSSSTFTVTAGGDVRYLIVGGGGGGGSAQNSLNSTGTGGGGGAGGFLTGTTAVSGISYTVTVGGGGAAGAAGSVAAGSKGANSVFNSLTATGGGGGASSKTAASTGGSGGGGSAANPGASGTTSQGHAGGAGYNIYPDYPTGGGGGAGTVGGSAGVSPGDGGNGLSSDITSTPIWYAGGGGGATLRANATTVGMGGTGGGGAGGKYSAFQYYSAVSGTANTGGGGGGACDDFSAGNGGSGIVIISYAQSAGASPTITGGTLSTPLSSTYGTASSATSFTLSGVNMTAGILVTAPAGFEVSQSSSSGYAGSTTVGAAGTIASTSVYVRLSATAPASATYNSKNIVLSSSGATSVNVPTTASGNSVSKATPTAALTVSNSPVTYNGSPKTPTCAISASSVTGTVQNILIGGASNQSDVGSYPVTADFVPSDTANYDTLTGLAAGDFVILTTFTTWIDTYYTGEVNPLIVGPGADPDQDGQPNFLEFALNSNPSNASSSGKAFVKMATVGAVPNVLTLSVAVRDYAGAFTADGNNQTALDPNDGITYHIEASTTLDNWGALLVTQVPDTDAAIIQTSLPVPAAGWSYKTFSTDSASRAAFIRVKVTSP